MDDLDEVWPAYCRFSETYSYAMQLCCVYTTVVTLPWLHYTTTVLALTWTNSTSWSDILSPGKTPGKSGSFVAGKV
jgi:hypothetical protein